METQADNRRRKLGCGGGRPDRLDRGGGRSCRGPEEGGSLFQYGCGRSRKKIRRFERAEFEGVYTRDCKGGACARRRNCLRNMEKDQPAESGECPAAGNQHIPATAGGRA